MGKPAIKEGDRIVATDMHIVIVPAAIGSGTQRLPHPFNGVIDGNLSPNVRIDGRAAATAGSTATNTPAHTPTPPGAAFQTPPSNQGVIMGGSGAVRINGKPAARAGDQTQTCADPAPNTDGRTEVSGTTTVMIGE